MGLYLGKKKLCSYNEKKVAQNSMKMLFDSYANVKWGQNYQEKISPFFGNLSISMEGWWQANDTENMLYMTNMFRYCGNITAISPLNTSNVTDMSSMFFECSKLLSVPPMDTSKVTNVNYMFGNCRKLSGDLIFDLSSVTTNVDYAFKSCYLLTSIHLLNTSGVTRMFHVFEYCTALEVVHEMDASNVSNMELIFYQCTSLKEIHMYGMKVSFDISYSTQFSESALVEILNNLASVTSTQTLTMGSTNLAKLTDDEKAIATGKGWTLK